MLLNAVILILQETLEAALLISVLAVVCCSRGLRFTWLAGGMLAGAVFASIYAANLQRVSEWFEYVGQEVVNAALQASISVLLVIFYVALLRQSVLAPAKASQPRMTGPMLVAAAIVSLAITRERSEIVLYLGGLLQQEEHVQAVLMGSGVGFGIGLSIGFLRFYGLLGLSPLWSSRPSTFLLALFAGNMLSQALLLLIQADWLPARQALWNSSAWLSEKSV